MNERARRQYKWFKAAIVLGGVLALVLLGQTVATYRYVSGNLVREAALREADRKMAALSRLTRLGGEQDAARLVPLLEELCRESPPLVWVRLLTPGGTVLARSGAAEGAPYALAKLSRILEGPRRFSEIRRTASGKVLVAVFPVPLGPPPSRLAAAELAIQLSAVSASFGRLRQNAVIGCLAAIALLAAMVFIGLRFGHYLRGKQYEEQLELARRVQRDLLPSGGLLSGAVDFAAECIPAWQVGGDLYDAFAAEHGRVAFALGDVSGKGLPAALLMALIHGAVRSSDWTASARDHEHSTRRLNELLCAETARERFASLFWCCFDPQTAVLRYVNAGHLPPLLIRQDLRGNVKVQRLEERGPVLGVLPAATYRHGEVSIRPGDLLVICSDGILEAADGNDQEFGEERLLSATLENWDRSPAEVLGGILARVRSFLGGEPPQDDRTLMVVRWQPVSAGLAPAVTETAGSAVLC